MSETALSPEAILGRDYMLALGELVVRYARVERAPRMPDGRRETDVEHSFHLGVTAAELAAAFYPGLDTGLIAEFANVHDLPEVYTGDVWTFDISDEDRVKKELAERAATMRLLSELPPHIADMLRRYEEQVEPEARFVRLVDKGLPAIINIMGAHASTFIEDHGVESLAHLRVQRAKQVARLREMYPEFSKIIEIRQAVSGEMERHYFADDPDL